MGTRNFQPDEFFGAVEEARDISPFHFKHYEERPKLFEGEEYGLDGKYFYVRPEFDIGDGMFVVYDSVEKPVAFVLHRGEYWISSNAWVSSLKVTAVYDAIKGLV